MKKITVTSSIAIKASADQVWAILGEGFQDVATWASTVDAAHPHTEVTEFVGAPGGGRVCTVPGFGETDERFTAFDTSGRTFTYSATAARVPGFVTNLRNTWTIRPLGAGRSEASAAITADVTGVLGQLMRR